MKRQRGDAPHSARLRWLVVLAFACVYLFWGSAFVAVRYSVLRIHPAFAAGLRYTIAGGVLLGFLSTRGGSLRLTAKDLRRVTALALLMFVCNTILLGYGTQVLSAGVAALVISTIPLFLGLLNAVLPGGEQGTVTGWLGTFTGFAGLLVLLLPGLRADSLTHQASFACAALLVAALAWAVGSVMSQRMKFTAAPLVCIAWQMLIGGAIDLLIGVCAGGLRQSQWTPGVWEAVAYLALACTLAGFTSYMFLLRSVSFSAAATYAYVNPVVAVLLGWLFFGERLVGLEWVGMAIVLASVAIVITANTRTRRTALRKT